MNFPNSGAMPRTSASDIPFLIGSGGSKRLAAHRAALDRSDAAITAGARSNTAAQPTGLVAALAASKPATPAAAAPAYVPPAPSAAELRAKAEREAQAASAAIAAAAAKRRAASDAVWDRALGNAKPSAIKQVTAKPSSTPTNSAERSDAIWAKAFASLGGGN